MHQAVKNIAKCITVKGIEDGVRGFCRSPYAPPVPSLSALLGNSHLHRQCYSTYVITICS